jgi:diguanylate cyclase (GGDEF)-like protein
VSPDSGPILVNAQQVRNLSPKDAARSLPVKLRAIVNYVDPAIGELFVQDATNGIFVFIKNSKVSSPLSAGQLVEIFGVTTPGDFAPAVTRAEISVVGKAPLPNPARLSYAEYADGQHECQRLEVDGIVESGRTKQGRLQLNVHTIGGSLVATMTDFPADWSIRLIRSKVRLRGVIAAIFDERRQAVGVRMFIPGDQVQVVEPAPVDPFALPLTSMSSIGHTGSSDQLITAKRVRGTVIAVQPGVSMYISDGTLTVEAQNSASCGATFGALVDVVGFPGTLGGRKALENSICRDVGKGHLIAPVMVRPQGILPDSRLEDASGYGYSNDSRYDMRVVQTDATLQQISKGQDADTWMLGSGQTLFSATVPVGLSRMDSRLQVGSHLQLTGVCIVSFDQFHRGESFRLLLRTADDVIVLERPPWWNLKHAAWVIGLILLSFVAAVSWISVLRRQVNQKTQELKRTNEILLTMSGQDGLTGIANRRHFDIRLEADFRRAIRAGGELSLLMADIDSFKLLNDEYGHQAGDQCLRQVANALTSVVLRTEDLVARYGGEEFAVILPWTDHAGALEVAERMRIAVQALAIQHAHSPFNKMLTVSVGVATVCPTARADTFDLIRLADRALYRSKASGRNRVSSINEDPGPESRATTQSTEIIPPPIGFPDA